MVELKQLTDCIEDSFSRYAGSVILDRAICDARDMLKPAARMLIYSQMKVTKNTPNKPYIKSARVVGDSLGHFYTHGDASCYGTYMRMAKPFAMRYPLEDCQGNSGTIITTGDEAAARYTELRLAKPAEYLYTSLEKNTIDKWNTNFDDTEEFPTVFPSIGYYNIVNGTTGIGVSLSSSVPQFNIAEVNAAISKLIMNPDIEFKDIVCMPDFATGGILINRDEVYESLKNGSGKACKIRAVVEYDPHTNSIHISEMPFGVYTSTITEQLRELTDADEHYGIEGIHDGSGQNVDYTIQLSKGVNPKKMIEKLFRDTSLEYWCGINMTMLDEGRFPKVFGWKEALQAHINHAADCLRKEYKYDLNKLLARQEIVEGLLMAIAKIDEVVATIKASHNSAEASTNLIAKFGFTEPQAKAILDLKLNRLVNLEGFKLEQEHKENQAKIEELNIYLTNKDEFNARLAERYQNVAERFGDKRRTKLMNLTENDNIIDVPEENLTIMVLSNDTIHVVKSEDMNGAKRGRKGTNMKLPKDTVVTDSIATTNTSALYVATKAGKLYTFSLKEISSGDYSIYELINIPPEDKIVKVMNGANLEFYKYLVLVTKSGLIKKTELSECKVGSRGTTVIKLKNDDEIINCFPVKEYSEDIIILSNLGYYNYYSHVLVNATGKNSIGVKAITLKDGEYVVAAMPVFTKEAGLFTILSNGKGKLTSLSELKSTSRAVRGLIAHKVDDGTTLMTAALIKDDSQEPINVLCNNHLVTLTYTDIPKQNRNTVGVKIIETKNNVNHIHII